ncbi:hypothetical protein OQH61_05715 [Helicobacter sp. MIT 21-1697]|uniref:hypothetical protein n=1 Tax=Helicobacter sp. MIT 21-1697 TaxID=2993733 RepID=UPI00224AF56A|nr:hypothetical protein [Helicobacter sp. MIT 21-1697]MCX2717231.1 hypothetical protein [Helicobacter sp. MIT 21-1697]
MKKYCIYILLGMLMGTFVACSDEPTDAISEQAPPKKPALMLEGNESLERIMDKIFENNVYNSTTDEIVHSLLPKEVQKSVDRDKFIPVEYKRYEIVQLFRQAYFQNKTHQIQSKTLEEVFALKKEWSVLCTRAQPYEKLPILQRLNTEIEISLSLLLLNNKDEIDTLENLLLQQYQKAKGTGELNTIIESQMQVRLLMLFGLYHLDLINQSKEEHSASVQVRSILGADLAQYKDFLPREHYEVYQRAFMLLNHAILKEQAPLDRILVKLLEFLPSLEQNTGNEDWYLHLERIKNAYEMAKIQDFSSPKAQELIQIAQNPHKNVYDNALMGNYLYGLDYLTLALLNNDVANNLSLALDSLQKDFKHFQIFQHHFEPYSFQNYLSSMFIGAYALYNARENQEYFNELLQLIKSELSQYSDVISSEDKDLYQDALFVLEQMDKTNFLGITFTEAKPKEEAGYIKIRLNLAPFEMERIKNIVSKENNALKENLPLCLSPQEADFMLSLVYQAYKTQGVRGVAPEMFKIRLEEVLGIENLEHQKQFKDAQGKEWGREYLIDFDRFILLGIADRACYVQNLILDEKLSVLQEKQEICGYNLYFDKENGLITNEILPSQILEIIADGNVYYRLGEADLNLNKFIFYNDENALGALKNMQDLGEILPVLLTTFPYMKDYLNNRLSPQQAQAMILRAKPKPCAK